MVQSSNPNNQEAPDTLPSNRSVSVNEQSSPLPSTLQYVPDYLPSDTIVINSGPDGMRWTATIQVKEKQFTLCSDRGYIDVYKQGDGHIMPPEEQRLSIAANQVAALIIGAL